MKVPIIRFLSLLFMLLVANNAVAQSKIIRAIGVVKDSSTSEVLSYASVIFESTTDGGMTDDNGLFSVQNQQGVTKLSISCLGYDTKTIDIKPGDNNNLTILLRPTSIQLQEVYVKPTKERYSRKNNPAVDLINKVIKNKQNSRIESKEQYQAELYEKLALAFDNFNYELDKGILKQFNFLKNYTDTSKFNGKPILTVSVRETISDVYYRKEPKDKKQIIKAKRLQGIDKQLDEGSITANLEEMFQPIDIFDNDIKILLNRFVSPLSSTLATRYYKYYILDTLDIAGERCVDLAFAPVNSESYAFTGNLYITLDGTYSIKKFNITTPHKINLNFVEKMRIEQTFVRSADSTWVLKHEDTFANFHVVEGTQQLYAYQSRDYNKYKDHIEKSDSIFSLFGNPHFAEDFDIKSEEYWNKNRPIPLEKEENAIEDLIAELKRVPIFNVLIKTIEILVTGYIPIKEDRLESKFDFGPMNTTFNANYVEGLRVRVGGMTTANLHDQLFATGFLAYGSSDRKFKYNTKLTYSFDKKKYHEGEMPVNNLSLIHEYDVYTPGQTFLHTSKDNMFVALKVGEPVTKMAYIRKSVAQYQKEWRNGLSILSWVKNENNEAAGTLDYILRDEKGNFTRDISFTTSELGTQIRFAPGERIYNSRSGRESSFNFSQDYPIFKLSHQIGFNGILGGEFRYNHTEFSAEKRLWLSSFGHIDMHLKAGKIWDKVPFPMLIMPNANQSLTIQKEAFHLMNAMEFFADQYISFDATYYMKGWIFNRIPGLKWFNLREVVSFSGFYGKLSDKNNPAAGSNNIYIFPDGTQPIGNTPYMEASAGLDNVFKILRIDYYRRLTYINNPDINKHGVRIALRFSL